MCIYHFYTLLHKHSIETSSFSFVGYGKATTTRTRTIIGEEREKERNREREREREREKINRSLVSPCELNGQLELPYVDASVVVAGTSASTTMTKKKCWWQCY